MRGHVGRSWFWVGLLSLIATGAASSWLSRANEQRLALELERQADRVAQQVETRFGLYEYGLRGARGAILAGGGAEIRRETFAAYSQSRELSREFPGARGFGLIRRWPAGQDGEALRRARADGMANFQLRELAPNPGERFVIEYIYPQASNQGATGLDIASERNRREAALGAARTASVQLTGPITLVQANQKPRQGFLMLLPVYMPGVLPEGADGRLAATLGWAYAPLLADEVLKPLLEAFPLVSMSLGEFDEPRPFFETHPDEATTATSRLPGAERTLTVFGRSWRLHVQASPALLLESRMAPVWLVLALGSLLSLLLALITRLATATPPDGTASELPGTGLTDFVRSPLARWSFLAVFAVGSAYAAFSWWQIRESVAARLERELQALIDQRAGAGETAMKGRQAALVYLRGTPPVDGLVRSDPSGRDPRDGSSTRLWQQRMAQIFGAYAHANPEAQELRLIRLTETASQLVTWRRTEGGASERLAVLFDQAPDPAWLRVLGDLRARLLRGEVWTHPIEAQKRPDPGAEPLRQTIRYTLPVLNGAELFGVLEMDIDVSARFAADALRLPWGGSLHVLNSEERWLTRQGLLEGQPGEGWSDRYTPAPLGIDTPAGRLRAWQGSQGGVLSAQSIIEPNPGDRSARVYYRAVVPTLALEEEVMGQWQLRMVAPTVIGFLLYGLLFLYWRLQQGHQGRLAALNADLARQVAEQTQDLQNERSRLSNILEGTGAGTWEWNAQTGETRVNSRWAEILGYALDALPPMTGEKWVGLIHPEDLAHTRLLLGAHLKGESPQYVCESRLRHQAQRWIWTLSTGRVMSRTPDGRAEWVSGTLLDISELRAAQLERERFANLLRSVLQAATDFSIIATEPDGLITVFNAGAERLLGYRADEVVGRQTPAIIHLASEVGQRGAELSASEGQEVQGFRVLVHNAEREGSEQREWTYVRKDGSHVSVSLTVTVVRNERGDVVGYLGIGQDISARLAAERALRHAKAAAEQASAAKGMFLANMSHEIRTPMNAIIGIAHLLADTPLNEDQSQLLGKLQISGRSLLSLIDDVLDLAKIEAGEMGIERVAYSPRDLLHELEAIFATQAACKGLSWNLQLPAELPSQLIGDAVRLRQVLSNLLSNALKFTASGGVSLVVGLEADQIRLTVLDTGIGIPLEAQSKLFQPFAQADASTTRRFGGTGLGLSISRRLVDLMGGRISLRSAAGEGAEFSVLLPLEAADIHAAASSSYRSVGQSAEDTDGARLQAVHLLVVDDSEINLEVLRRMLEREGAKVVCETSAAAALARLERAERFDAVILDIQMPDIDGLEATRRIRQMPGLDRLPVLALTAGALAEERRRALDAGMDEFLTKPVDPAKVVQALSRHLAPLSTATNATESETIPRQIGTLPVIDGLNVAEALPRLGGDLTLFHRLIARLLSTFDTPWLAGLAARSAAELQAEMHKLRGSASLLGAARVEQLAFEAEARLRQGGLPDEVRPQLDALAEALAALRPAAAPILGTAAKQSELTAPTTQPLPEDGAQRLDRLLTLLRQQDLGAGDALAALLPWLSEQRLPDEELHRLSHTVAELDFGPAIQFLSAWKASGGSSRSA